MIRSATAGEDADRLTEHREAQRAATKAMLRRMAGLPQGEPERERLRSAIIESHLSYARHIARRFAGGGRSTEDLQQVACLGLVKAVDNFDFTHGESFLAYATPTMIGEIKRYFRDATWDIHVPRRLQQMTGQLQKATERLTAELGRAPSIREVADRLGAEDDEVVDALDATSAYHALSLDQPVAGADADADGSTLGDLMGAEDPGFDLAVDRTVLRELVAELCERDKKILLMRFFHGMTQTEIAARLGISQMHVSRLIARIIGELRRGFE